VAAEHPALTTGARLPQRQRWPTADPAGGQTCRRAATGRPRHRPRRLEEAIRIQVTQPTGDHDRGDQVATAKVEYGATRRLRMRPGAACARWARTQMGGLSASRAFADARPVICAGRRAAVHEGWGPGAGARPGDFTARDPWLRLFPLIRVGGSAGDIASPQPGNRLSMQVSHWKHGLCKQARRPSRPRTARGPRPPGLEG